MVFCPQTPFDAAYVKVQPTLCSEIVLGDQEQATVRRRFKA